MPDGSRIFEEVDRFGIGRYGTGNQISDKADVDFFRIVPSAGYTKGLPAAKTHGQGPRRCPTAGFRQGNLSLIDRGTFRGRRRG